jgi:ribulose-phosphate 3-epimerase
MIVNPQNYISQVRDCGAEFMNVHQEACIHLHRTVQAIKNAGMKAGVTINPSTPVSSLEDIITEVDMVLIMSVNPGFGGQSFIPNSVKKVLQLKELINRSNSNAVIEVDGGVNLETGKLLADAGADILVAGNSVFSAPSPKDMILKLHNL